MAEIFPVNTFDYVDFIIAVYRMPKLDGAKFYYTGAVSIRSIDELKALDLKFEKVDFLEKPFSREDVLKKIISLKQWP